MKSSFNNFSLVLLSKEEEKEIAQIDKKYIYALTSVFTVDRCKKMLIKVLTVDMVQDLESFHKDRGDWLKAIRLHHIFDGIKIATLLFDTYMGEIGIQRIKLIKIWEQLIAKAQSENIQDRNVSLLWRQLGILNSKVGKFGEATKCLRKSSQIAENFSERIILGDNYYEMGVILRNQGKYDQAWESFINAEKYTEMLHHYKTIIYSQGQRANILAIKGRFSEAIELLQKSLDLWNKFQDSKDNQMRHTTLHTLGRLYYQSGMLEEAKDTLKQSLNIKEQMGEGYDAILGTRALLAEVLIDLGNYKDATKYLSEDIIEISITNGGYLYAANALRILSKIKFIENDLLEAERLAKRSISNAKLINNPITKIDSLFWIWKVSFYNKRYKEIFATLNIFLQAFMQLKLSPKRCIELFFERFATVKGNK